MISETQYKNWQTKLKTNSIYRYWWQFWSNYAFVFFVPAFIIVYTHDHPYEVIGLCALSFFVARIVITQTINFLYHRERPYQKYKFQPLTSMFFSWKTSIPNSFPSRHASAYASVAFTIVAFYPVAGLILIAVTILTGFARVILGYHYPSDIVAGILIGAATGLLLAWLGPIAVFT